MVLRKLALSCACCLTLAATASAQDPYWGGYGYGGYHHASTVQEGVQRGFADIVRSAGEANLRNSEAAINYEDARSKYFDNRLKGTNTYFEMRQMNKQYRNAERTAPLSSEQLYRIAAESAPKKLRASDLDPLTGDITWPLILQADEFSERREQLDALFLDRASGRASTQNMLDIQRIVQLTMDDLKANIRAYPANEYMQAKKFLESLAFSSRSPTT
ncbi:MAG: hypothetical protein KDA41_13855 [Planctomycetales bacterium]|nr:hypothetical protein [Planctomycetales bacterium]